MKCDYCELIAAKDSHTLLFEDQDVLIILKEDALTPGHIMVLPREHFTIMEMVPDPILGKCAALANAVGVAVFDSLNAQGTNIFVRNGLSAGQIAPHFSIEIIPRREGDSLDFTWQAAKLGADEMDITHQLLKDALQGKPQEKNNTKPSPQEAQAAKDSTKQKKDDGENYLLKSLRRLP